HDPQPTPLIPRARELGAAVAWRCHIGTDTPGPAARAAWRFLAPYVSIAEAAVFSRGAYAWDILDEDRVAVIHPSIDPFSAKNNHMEVAAARAVLRTIGLLAGSASEVAPRFTRAEGSEDTVRRRAELIQVAPLSVVAGFVVQ